MEKPSPIVNLRKVVSPLFLIGALYLFFLVAMIVITGGRWEGEFLGLKLSAGTADSRLLVGIALLWLRYLICKRPALDSAQRKQVLGKSFLLLFSLALTFPVAEVATRILLQRNTGAFDIKKLAEFQESRGFAKPTTATPLAHIIKLIDHPELVIDLQNNLNFVFGNKQLITNSDGMRAAKDYSIEKPANTSRIVGIGDSGMFGWGVEQEEPFLAVLEKNLNAKAQNKTWEVLNLGTPSYNTHQEVEMLKYKGLKYNPDMVILHWCFNDFQPPLWHFKPVEIKGWDTSYFTKLLFKRNKLMDSIRPRVIHSRDHAEEMPEDRAELNAGTPGVVGALTELKALALEHDFKLLIFGPLGSSIQPILKEIGGFETCNTYDEIKETPQTKEWLVHQFHPKAEGHNLLAELLESSLEQRGWLE